MRACLAQRQICETITMVRSHLDYAMAVWHPYKIKHKIALENIQRRATKELPGGRYEGPIIYRKTQIA